MKKCLMTLALCFISLSLFAEESTCPHHSDHQKQMEERGNHVMGFDQDRTVHHFVLKPDGGIIRAQATRANDLKSIEGIRKHFVEIASRFSKGDFSQPATIHGRVPSGVPTMTKLRKEIAFTAREITNGSEVYIKTENEQARKAIHEFLKFQIEDHNTGDPFTIQD